MVLVLRHHERVSKESKHQASDAADHEVNEIVSSDIDSRADTCCAGMKCRLLSTTGQLCDVKGFQNSYKAIINIPVSKSATLVVHDYGTVYILILNEAILFGKSMDHSLIN